MARAYNQSPVGATLQSNITTYTFTDTAGCISLLTLPRSATEALSSAKHKSMSIFIIVTFGSEVTIEELLWLSPASRKSLNRD